MDSGIKTEVVHRGRLYYVQRLSWTDGEGRAVRRDIVRHPGAVLIIPVLDDHTLIMIRNFRVAVDDFMLEFPAGTLEPDESPEVAATRELEEETGYRAGKISRLGDFYTSPGFADELMHVYVAEELTHVGQNLDAGEEISVETISPENLSAMICDGRMRDGKSIAAFFLWQHAQRSSAT